MQNKSGIFIAFDYGLAQIGVAVAESVTASARGLTILKAKDGVPNWDAIKALLQEWQPVRVVVGLPLNMDGSQSEMAVRAEKFARRLHGRFGVEVELYDERLSSFEARQLREERLQNERGGEMRGYMQTPAENKIDAIAAAVILQGWLDQK